MSSRSRTLIFGSALLVVALLSLGILPRIARHKELRAERNDVVGTVPTVTVAKSRLGEPTSDLTLPATVRGLHETALYARANGYVKRVSADMGSHVRVGQTLAELETPELEQELGQAQATLRQIEASRELTRATLARWNALVEKDAATKQELDEKRAAFDVASANAAAVRANVERLTALRRFATIVAPFSGVVTSRTVDVGALVIPGQAARPLFTLAQVDTVRVTLSVPQSSAADVHGGQKADVLVRELGMTPFTGTIARTAQALDAATRSLPIEIEVPNPKLSILPGMYAQVKLSLARGTRPVLIPANTLMVRADGALVAVVRDGRVHLVKITLGRDYGTEVTALSGIEAGETLVVNPGDDIAEGAPVRIAPDIRP